MKELQNTYNADFNESEFDFKDFITKYFKYWPWFLFSLISALIIAFIYLRYTPNLYRTSATVIIKEEEGGSSTSASDVSTFIDLGMLGGMGSNKIENEIGVLKSRRMMRNVVNALNLSTSFFKEGDVRDVEVFNDIPVNIEVISLNTTEPLPKNLFRINFINNSNLELVNIDTGNTYVFTDGKPGNIEGYEMIISIINPENNGFLVKFSNAENLAKKYSAALNINQQTDKGTLLELSLSESVPKKSEAIINQLIFEYNKEAIEDKNLVARNTRDFIDERLLIINEELDSVEVDKEEFKEVNKLTDIQSESQLFIENASDYKNRELEVRTQIQVLEDMLNVLRTGDKNSTLPANLGLNGDMINSQIEQYNKLVIERNRILSGSTLENPVVVKLNYQIEQMQGIVLESLKRIKSNLEITLKDLLEQNININSEISNIPNKERVFRGIVRQQDIKESLYLYLLQKREENSLSLAVKAPKAKIVDSAYTENQPISPNRKMVYVGSLLLGLLLPFSVVYLRGLFNNTILNKKELSSICGDVSVVGELPRVNKKESDLIEENDRSVLAEAFRMLLTNLQYLLVEKIKDREEGITTFVTSTVKGEGKTFVSFNLAITMANTGKKVLIVGADLRNPQLQRYQKGAKQMHGLSDYLVDSNLTVGDIVSSSELNKNLDFLPSGSIPPNPSELLQLKRTDELFGILRKQYDYIIVDTAPSMVVADTFLINHLADVTIHVVRAKYTDKKLVQFALDSKREGKLKNLAFVLNDVDSADFGYYGSKYGYAYGYGSDQESFFSKIKNRFR